eukprot:gnl/TRDRNA2_/TRDRNA2_87489_c0_seq1.p1 gnl/TRDRNA2_/TRDRNA2_87489_c0~~gnl/TRDRNA2_/TRDRNA2_87489_c0_seq1.p1  ORF type:complete len:487 (-),score=91.63 gnl/TRDRNA2_/TRDRNA2_87489_c0_seq1:64-1437(-)
MAAAAAAAGAAEWAAEEWTEEDWAGWPWAEGSFPEAEDVPAASVLDTAAPSAEAWAAPPGVVQEGGALAEKLLAKCPSDDCSIARAAGAGTSLASGAADESGSDCSEFEPSFESLSSDSSEIPEAILEESSGDDRPPPPTRRPATAPWTRGRPDALDLRSSAEAWSDRAAFGDGGLLRPVLKTAWETGWGWSSASGRFAGGPWLRLGAPPAWEGGQGAVERPATAHGDPSTPSAAAVAATLTPVRRARVRGTVFLPTSARQPREPPPQPQPQPMQQPQQQPSDTTSREVATDQALRAEVAAAEREEALAAERALMAERLLAADRALAAEEALAAERASYEEELERHALEALERQAVLQALDDDRAALEALYQQARRELQRYDSEVSELKRSQDVLRREVARLSQRSACVVCLDRKATLCCVPCGHLALCEGCASQLMSRLCPVCRQPSQYIIHVFMP